MFGPQRVSILAVFLLFVSVCGRPPAPLQPLQDLHYDFSEDLEDARKIDEAYERLFGLDEEDVHADSEARAPVSVSAPQLDDYDGELPQGDMPVEDMDDDDAQALPASGEDLESSFRYKDLLRGTSSSGAKDPIPEHILMEELNPALHLQKNGSDEPTGVPDMAYTTRKSERESVESTFVERNKELRLQNIKTQILNYLGLQDAQPSVNASAATPQQLEVMRDMVSRMKLPHWSRTDVYTEKVHSHYPSCALPKNTDEELWGESNAMNLLFDLTYPQTQGGATVNIIQAKLRLFKLSQGNLTTVLPSPCAPTSSSPSVSNSALQAVFASASEDRQVRVSVYWYTRSLKKNRVKRKLLDSRMVSVLGAQWTEWNVRPAVKVWRDSGRNFGLVVEVEDEDGSLLPAQAFFSGMNCSQDASTARPLPSFLLDAAKTYLKDNNSQPGSGGRNAHTFNQDLFPMIDLCTVETADDGRANIKPQVIPLAVMTTPSLVHQRHRAHPLHRHRHPHQRQRHDQDLTDDEESRPRAPRGQEDIRKFIIPQRVVLSAAQQRSLTESQDR